MTKQSETIEAQPRTIAEIEQEQAALEAKKQAIRDAAGLAAALADAKIRQEDAEREHLRACYSVMADVAPMWKDIHELAGKRIEDPGLMLGLVLFAMMNPRQPNTNENTYRDHLRAYVQGWELGIDPGNPVLNDIPGFQELEVRRIERERKAEADRRANLARRQHPLDAEEHAPRIDGDESIGAGA